MNVTLVTAPLFNVDGKEWPAGSVATEKLSDPFLFISARTLTPGGLQALLF